MADTTPKGMVADHWTWRDGVAHVTGWHRPVKRGKAEPEVQPTGRGIVAVSLAQPKVRRKHQQGKLL